MPFYTVFDPAGSLDAAHKRAVAKIVTDLHCRVTKSLPGRVNLIFREHGPDDLYVGGKPSARILVHGLISKGPPVTDFLNLMRQLAIGVAEKAEAPCERVAIVLQEVTLSEGVELDKSSLKTQIGGL